MESLAAVSFSPQNLFTACFFWAFAGMIAGTVANYVVRGKGGCIFGNFFLGLIGAMLGTALINVVVRQSNITLGFIETTIIASIIATLIAYIFHTARKAEQRHQDRLLEK